jgi:hypothetical protein
VIRKSIRENYERLLFLDLEFAASKDVEQARWAGTIRPP